MVLYVQVQFQVMSEDDALTSFCLRLVCKTKLTPSLAHLFVRAYLAGKNDGFRLLASLSPLQRYYSLMSLPGKSIMEHFALFQIPVAVGRHVPEANAPS